MTQLEDWKRCNDLYCNWMYYEAAESGYDVKASRAANEAYLKAFMAFSEKYGVTFNPDAEPKTSILADAEEIGMRVEYAKYLETCRGRGIEFEEWKSNREMMN